MAFGVKPEGAKPGEYSMLLIDVPIGPGLGTLSRFKHRICTLIFI